MMRELIENSAFLGVVITIGSFELGRAIRKKWNFALFNPLLLAILFSIGVLLLFRIDYGSYLNGAKYINFLLTPATVCLAVPLYEKFELLKKNALAITLGIAAGVAASLATVFALAALFRLDFSLFTTLLPKSITTAIGMDVSEELGGYPSLTVAAIILTGVLGNICADGACRVFRITSPIAQGVAIGTAAHRGRAAHRSARCPGRFALRHISHIGQTLPAGQVFRRGALFIFLRRRRYR